jgi:hypothetical protein
VARLIFNAQTLKLCSKIKFAIQGSTNRAVSIRCRIFSVMSDLGQTEKYSERAYIFRSSADNRHPRRPFG